MLGHTTESVAANVAFADGSVRFLKEDISIGTMAAIVTAKSGEIFDLDD